MTWIYASLVAAVFLGIYDLCNKHAVAGNAVFPVIFFSTVTTALVWTVLMSWEAVAPGSLPRSFQVDSLTLLQHGEIFIKSVIAASSWVFTYFAVKHLPISIAGPIRSTGPLWTFAAALLIFGERPHLLQGIGVVVTLLSFIALSFAGRAEGISFHRDKWVGYMIAGTMCGVISTLYDKHLFAGRGFRPATVQAWFAIYLVLLFLPLVIGWKRRWWPRGDFYWRWSIPCIGLALLVSDYLYFAALREPDGLVSVVTAIRRSSVLVGFLGGLWWFGEKNGWRKLPAIFGLLLGVVLIVIG